MYINENSVLIDKKLMFYSHMLFGKRVFYFELPREAEKETSFFIRPEWLVKEEGKGFSISFLKSELVPVFKKTENISSKEYQRNTSFTIIKEAYENA